MVRPSSNHPKISSCYGEILLSNNYNAFSQRCYANQVLSHLDDVNVIRAVW